MTILHTLAKDALRIAAQKLGLELVTPQYLADLRANHRKALDDLSHALKTVDRLNALIGERLSVLTRCHEILNAAGIPGSGKADDAAASLEERIEHTLAHPVERDWTWAIEQIHAGKTVTHPLVQSPGDTRGHVRQAGTFLIDGAQTPVYQILQGSLLYSQLTADSHTWCEFAHRAQRSYGWEIVPEKKPEP